MLENLRDFKRKYRKEPALHLVFLLAFSSILGLSYLNVDGFLLPVFFQKLLVFLISVNAISASYYCFIKRPRK
tara:strand:- start:2113 stop:2331 length:219 start_codon:yes stop_codon:yes gene_type:complete